MSGFQSNANNNKIAHVFQYIDSLYHCLINESTRQSQKKPKTNSYTTNIKQREQITNVSLEQTNKDKTLRKSVEILKFTKSRIPSSQHRLGCKKVRMGTTL